jgi:hypothetical protein
MIGVAVALKHHQIPFFGSAENPFDCATWQSFCASRRAIVETVIRIPERQVVSMHNHDFWSDGFLAVTAASLVLLCSGLLAIAFA